jgi:multiple sugar transport system permease protein
MGQSEPLSAASPPTRLLPKRMDAAAETGSAQRQRVAQVAIAGTVLIGVLIMLSMPAIELADGSTLSYMDANERITLGGDGWVGTLGWFGVAIAVISAFAFPFSERFAGTLAVTLGAVLAMVPAYYMNGHIAEVDENATGLAGGMVIAWVLFGVAAAIPWISVLWINRQKSIFGRNWTKWLFLLPAIIWILALTVFPLIYAITTSRYAYRNGRIDRPVGWDNYRRLFEVDSWGSAIGGAIMWAAITGIAVMLIGAVLQFLGDRELTRADLRDIAGYLPLAMVPAALVYLIRTVLKDPLGEQLNITLIFVVISVSIEMVLGFLLALLLNRELRARGQMRAIITLPIFATPIGVGYLARSIFYEEGGPLNAALEPLGFAPPWLSDPVWARIATIIVDVWQWTPFVFIISLAGLQGLPQDVVEASEVDGSSSWQVLRYVTLPLMAPILWLILLLRTIDGFKVFDIPSGLTLGGPGRATEYFSLFNYRTARKFFNYGDAAAQAFLLLFIVMLLVSLLWSRIQNVYEEDEVARA